MKTPPTPFPDQADTGDRVRLTISVTPEVHEAFTRLSKASGVSLSRAMGEWLADTLDAVTYTAQKVEEARAAPKLVMRQMHAYALGLADETGSLLDSLRAKGAGARLSQAVGAPAGHPAPTPPRPVIRGGNSTGQVKPRGSK